MNYRPNLSSATCVPNGVSNSLDNYTESLQNRPIHFSALQIGDVASSNEFVTVGGTIDPYNFSRPLPYVKCTISSTCGGVSNSSSSYSDSQPIFPSHPSPPSYQSHGSSLSSCCVSEINPYSSSYPTCSTNIHTDSHTTNSENQSVPKHTFVPPPNRTATYTPITTTNNHVQHPQIMHETQSSLKMDTIDPINIHPNSCRSKFSVSNCASEPSMWADQLQDVTNEQLQERVETVVDQNESTSLPHLNMKYMNVLQYPKYTSRKNSGFERRLKHTGLVLDPKVTLRLLRKLLQPHINRSVNEVVQRYMEEYISIAVRNIRTNLGENSVTEADLVKFRKSIMHRVALQYFEKEELVSHTNMSYLQPSDRLNTHDRKTTLKQATTTNCEQSLLPSRRKRLHDAEIPLRQRILTNQALRRRRRNLSENLDCKTGESSTQSSYHSPVSEDHGSTRDQPGMFDSDDQLEILYSAAFGLHNSHQSNRSTSNAVLRPSSLPVANLSSDYRKSDSSKLPSIVLSSLNCEEVLLNSYHSDIHSDSSTSSGSLIGFSRELSSPDDFLHSSNQTNLLLDLAGNCDASEPSGIVVSDKNISTSLKHSAPSDGRLSLRSAEHASDSSDFGPSTTRTLRNKRSRRVLTGARNCHLNTHIRQSDFACVTSNQDYAIEVTSSGEVVNDMSNVPSKPNAVGMNISTTHSTDHHQPLPTGLNMETLFILGSSANTLLGMGAARGRIYTKHPHLFRYLCDIEDKSWLVNHGLLQSQGVKAYLMLFDQIQQVADQYHLPTTTGDVQSQTFTVPPWFLFKINSATNTTTNRTRIDSSSSRENNCTSESFETSMLTHSLSESGSCQSTPCTILKVEHYQTRLNSRQNLTTHSTHPASSAIELTNARMTDSESSSLHPFFNGQHVCPVASEQSFNSIACYQPNQPRCYTRSTVKSKAKAPQFCLQNRRTPSPVTDKAASVPMLFTPPRCSGGCESPSSSHNIHDSHEMLSSAPIFSAPRSPRPPTLERFDYL